MSDVIIWGGTGQARVLHEALTACDVHVLAVFDNRAIPSPFPDIPIYFGEEGLHSWRASQTTTMQISACVAIGGHRGRERVLLQEWLQHQGIRPRGVIHPRAFVAGNAELGEGAQILAMSSVCTNARLGRSVIVNTSASVDHDCIIGEGAHIGPGAIIAGEVHVDDYAFIGAGAVVLPRLKIGRDAVVGAGAVVTHDVAPAQTVAGNPARSLRR